MIMTQGCQGCSFDLLSQLLLLMTVFLTSTALASSQGREGRGIGPYDPQLAPTDLGCREGADRRIYRQKQPSPASIRTTWLRLLRCNAFQWPYMSTGRNNRFQDKERRLHITHTLCIPRRGTRPRRLSDHICRLLLFDVKDGGDRETDATDGQPWPLGSPAVIWFDEVTKNYENRRWFASPRQVEALEETTLVLEGPGPFALVGDSGAGKSTFLRLLSGDLTPSSGRIYISPSRLPTSGATILSEEQAAVEGAAAGSSGAISPMFASSTIDGVGQPKAVQRAIPGATPPRGVAYIDRHSIQKIAKTEAFTVAEVLSTAFDSHCHNPSQQYPSPEGLQGAQHSSAELLLSAAGLRGVRDRPCRDLSRGQLLCLVLCIGVAHALAERETSGSLWRFGELAAREECVECEGGDVPAPVLCLDEFLEVEDARVRRGVENACARLNSLGVTIVFATHVMDHVEGMLTSTAGWPSDKASHTRSGSNSGGGGRVVTFTEARANEPCRLEACAYVEWKRSEDADRQARRLM